MDDVLVLYEDTDELYELSSNFGPEADDLMMPAPNAFYLEHEPHMPVRLLHLERAFPLCQNESEAHFLFRAQDKQGRFVDLVNPASLVPRNGPEGGIVLKIFRSPAPRTEPSTQTVQAELAKPVPAEYWEYEKFQQSAQRRRPNKHKAALDALTESVESFEFDATVAAASDAVKEGVTAVKDMGRKLSTQLGGLDEEKLKKQGKKLLGGIKSLWGKAKESTEAALREAGAAASSMASSSMQIGRYRVKIERELAEGGFSVVYLARDEATNQPLAVKKMVAQTKDARQDATTEVKLLRAMDHPNIISVMDTEVLDVDGQKHFYLLFEYIQQTAYDVMAANIAKSPNYDFSDVNTYASPFTESQALECVLGCCEALAYMHEKMRICHRDFKPHNVLLKTNGGGFMGGPTAVVMDVGSASPLIVAVKTRSDALKLEEEAASKCSAPYRCPELTEVNVGVTVDGGSDMWSLGCSLFALAFGYCPFETPKEGVMKLGILNGRYSFPRNASVTNFSEGYRNLISKLLSGDSNDRGSARDCAAEIKQLLRRN
jgi:serine/threonine kinase 16